MNVVPPLLKKSVDQIQYILCDSEEKVLRIHEISIHEAEDAATATIRHHVLAWAE